MKFKCQESCGGKCCKPGWRNANYIFLTEKDTQLIEKSTGIKRNMFSKVSSFEWTRFSKTPVKARYMGEHLCPFFAAGTGTCGIYDIRPTQCRTFPQWPELMDQDVSGDCPGIGQGVEIGNGLLEEQIEADKEYAC